MTHESCFSNRVQRDGTMGGGTFYAGYLPAAAEVKKMRPLAPHLGQQRQPSATGVYLVLELLDALRGPVWDAMDGAAPPPLRITPGSRF